MVEEKSDFNKEYESRLKAITVRVKNRDGEEEDVKVPVCYAKATTHIRKPMAMIDPKELKTMMYKTIECSDCDFLVSCMELTKVDLQFSQLLALRDIRDVLCAIGNVLLDFFKEVLNILKQILGLKHGS